MIKTAKLLSKYYTKGISSDTNILLLYLVGSVNRARIFKFKRTRQFITEDYDLLLKLFQDFQKVIATPNILTEVNSLANQLGEPERSQCMNALALLTSQVTEEYIESITVSKHELFYRFGLTDCGIISTARNKYLVLTNGHPQAPSFYKSRKAKLCQSPSGTMAHTRRLPGVSPGIYDGRGGVRVTDDLKLHLHLKSQGIDTVNFNNLRNL